MSKYNIYIERAKKRRYFVPTKEQVTKWLTKNGIDFKEGKNSIRLNSPDGDDKQCMSISNDGAFVKDWRINHDQYNGSFVKFVSKYKNITSQEAITEIADGDSINFVTSNVEPSVEVEKESIIKMPEGSISLRNDKGKAYEILINYLTKIRFLSMDIIKKSNIRSLI